MGNKGSNTTTTSTAPNPVAGAAYTNLIQQAGNVAATPYQAYGGQLVAPTNQQQGVGIAGINQYANSAQPYLQQAGGLAATAAQPISAQDIQNYENPYTQQVVNSTEAQFQNTNAQQQQQVLGNAVAQGALGGDRSGVAQAVLAGQQQASEAPVIAGLENTGYNTATQTALAEQQAEASGAYNLGNVGTSIENAGLSGANAQVGAGTLQQQTQQAEDTAAYQQFEQALAYPFQTTSWEAGIDTGVGSQLGGTSETTAPAPNYLNSIIGLGAAGVGAYGNYYQGAGAKRGGRIQGLDTGGAPYGGSGSPYSSGLGWVPTMSITPGRGAPPPPNVPQQQGAGQMMQNAASIANAFKGRGNNSSNFTPDLGYADFDNGVQTGIKGVGPTAAGLDAAGADAYGGSSFDPLPGLDSSDYGEGYRHGGMVATLMHRHALKRRRGGNVPIRGGLGLSSFLPRARGGFADGGSPYDEDYFDAAFKPDQGFVGQQYGLATNPSAAANYAARAATDSSPSQLALSAPGFGAGAAYGQTNPYAPTPQARPAAADAESLPPEISAGVSSPPPAQQAGLGMQSDDALGYTSTSPQGGLSAPPSSDQSNEPAPAPQQRKGLFGLSPDFYTSLMAAGFGMAASRSPFVGVALGEGGLQGLSTYGGLQQQHLAQQKQQQDVDLKVKQLDQQAKAEQDRVANETRSFTQLSAAEKADLEFKQRAEQRQEMQPVKVGTDMSTGTDIYAVRDPNAPGGFRRIDPSSFGTPGGTPQGTGVPVTPPTSSAPTTTPPATPSSDEAQLPSSASPVSGDTPDNVKPEVLQTLDPNLASQVKALDEGRMAFPTGFALKSPYWQNILRLVSNYDPSFDAVNYNARAKTRADFVAGKSAQNITSFNTAIGHLDTLDKSIDALGNTNYPWLNPLIQGAKSATGDTGFQSSQKQFAAAKQAVTDELTRAFRGSGGNVHDIVGWEQTLNQADSPSALHAAVKSAVNLLQSRIESVGDQYNRGMGTTRDPLTMLSPHAQAAITRLSGDAQTNAATVDPRDAAALKANASNPAAAAAIDKKYGVGTAAHLLGTQ